MGFDNECILNIQSLPGEYFCPVCRTLIFPNEALQSQCTHLYCKPCLAYIVATTHACPYDGYLVTEADSKPLLELNKSLAETIGKVQVYCLYHRSGCQWQGTLSDCINHCIGCNFGNSPVVCNRCGTQIVHRQVQEHAQTCPGLQPQGQQIENVQVTVSPASNQDATQNSSAALPAATPSSTAAATTVMSTSTAAVASSISVPTSAPTVVSAPNGAVQVQNQAATVAYPQIGVQAPTVEQWYRQQQLQYQQYYQQYPGYDPYQQQYQQYGQYPQQTYQQYPQTHMQVAPQQVIQGQQQAQQQAQPYMQPQPQVQPHTPVQAQPQVHSTHLQTQQQQLVPQPQPQPQLQPQPQPQPQPQLQLQTQPNPHPQPQSISQPQPQPQSIPQPQPQPQSIPQPQPQPHSYLQPQPQPQLPAPPQPQPQPYPYSHPHPQPHPQSQLHSHSQPQLQTQLPYSQLPQAQHVSVQHSHQQVQPQMTPQATQIPAHPGQPQYLQMQPYAQAQQPAHHSQQHQPAVLPQQQLPQPPAQHPQHHTQSQPRALPLSQAPYNQTQPQFQQPRPLPQGQPQPLAHPQPQPQPQSQNPSAHAVTGHQSYPQLQSHQQTPHGMLQQRPMNLQQPVVSQQTSQSQFPIHQAPQLRPSQTYMPPQTQQHATTHPQAQISFSNAASQPLPPHLAHQPGQQTHHSAGIQLQTQQLALPQQQALGQFPSAQLSHQGGLLPPSHSPQSLRPQAQSYIQSNGPVQGRSIASNQPQSQKVQHSPTKPIQSSMNQHSPNHNHAVRQLGSIHHESQDSVVPAPSRSGTETSQVSVSGSDLKSTALERPVDSVLDKVSQGKPLEADAAAGNADGSETSRSSDPVNSKLEDDSKTLVDGETRSDVNETVETKESKDGFVSKHLKGVAADFQDGIGLKEAQGTEGKKIAIANSLSEGIAIESVFDGPNAVQPLSGNINQFEKIDQVYSSRSKSTGNVANMAHASQSMPAGQQKLVEVHDKALAASGYHDKGLSQFPPPQLGALDHERCSQNIPHGHSSNIDALIVSQRPPGADGMFPQNMSLPTSSQARKFQEPFQQAMLGHGPSVTPGQVWPPGYSENIHYPVQTAAMAEPFQPPAAKQSYISNILPKNAEEIVPFPIRNLSHGPLLNAVGPTAAQIDPLARSFMPGPPPGVFDASSGMMARGSHFGYDDRAGRSGSVNLIEGPGYFDGKQSESHRSLPGEYSSFGQPTVMLPNMKMNGLSGKGTTGIMHDLSFSHGMPDERFQPPSGERFKPLLEESLRNPPAEIFRPVESGWNISNRREFEEDLKQFPRSSHLDGDGAHKFNAYAPVSRAIERGQYFGPDGGPRPFDRSLISSFPPPHPPSGRFPPISGGLEFGPLEISGKQRVPPFHGDLGGKNDVHPDRLRPFSEFGRSHIDNLTSLKSPGARDGSGHFRKELDAFDATHSRVRASEHVTTHGFANHIRVGEPFGTRNFPSHLMFNDSANHGPLRGGESIGFGGFGRIPVDDSGFSNSFPVHDSVSFHGDVNSFENLRKKHGSMGWCRLCKIDCETVEGLEVHSQTKDHQNMAMEIVLNIKKENAKKQKLISEESEDKNKPRQATFENRGGRR